MIKKLNIPKWPIADNKEEEKLKEVLQSSNWWRNAGTQVKAFEKAFAEFQGCENGITVANGTQAIEIALKALGIGEGDEVIIPDFTFYSTASAVLAVNATPVLVDVDEDTYCIDPKQIVKAVTGKTKAIIPVHMAGNIANMKEINEIAKKFNLYVIEDSSHAHGAFVDGKGAGSLGTLGTFSFQNAKLMTSGEGGIVIGSETYMNRILLEVNCGRAEQDTNYQHILIGTNSRLSEFQGAVLNAQLMRLSEQVELREKNYKHLEECFSDIQGIKMQRFNNDMTINPHYMIMFYYDREMFNGAERSLFVQYLREAGIPCNRAYESIHKLPIFKALSKSKWRVLPNSSSGKMVCMNSELISDTVVCFNHNILLSNEKLVEDIADVIRNFKSRR